MLVHSFYTIGHVVESMQCSIEMRFETSPSFLNLPSLNPWTVVYLLSIVKKVNCRVSFRLDPRRSSQSGLKTMNIKICIAKIGDRKKLVFLIWPGLNDLFFVIFYKIVPIIFVLALGLRISTSAYIQSYYLFQIRLFWHLNDVHIYSIRGLFLK